MRYDDVLLFDPSGQDQQLVFSPDARVITASWYLENPDHASGTVSRYVASGTVAVDPVSTGLTHRAGAGQAYPNRIYVDDATTSLTASQGLEIVHSGSGDIERVEVRSVGGWDPVSGSYITTRFPIHGRDFPSGSTLRGNSLSITIPGSVVSDESLFRNQETFRLFLTWRAGSRMRTGEKLIRFERTESLGFNVGEIERSIRAMWQGLSHSRLSSNALRDMIGEAIKEIEIKLRQLGREPSELLADGLGNMMAVWKTAEYYAKDPTKPDDARLEEFGRYARNKFEKLFTSFSNGDPGKGIKQVERHNDTAHKPRPRNPFVSIWGRRDF